nr:YaaC family protein [Treponema denticola]
MVPLLKEVNDPIAINYMLLYTLSIIVRYLPDMWYEIVQGKYANIGRLIDYYISIYDHVIPHQMLERITGKKLYLSFPGGFDSPV